MDILNAIKGKLPLIGILAGMLAGLTASPSAFAAEHVYKVAIDAEFAPFEFADVRGRALGIAPDILRAIGKSTGFRFEISPMSWSQAVDALQTGRIDMLQMIRTKKRMERFAFSEPFIYLTQALFVNKSSDMRSMKDISGKRIAVQRHDIAEEMIGSRKDIHRIFVDNKRFGMELVQQKEADGFFAAELPGQYLLRNFDSWPDVRMAEGGLYPQPLCFATRKGNHALITLINQSLTHLKQTGRLDSIIAKWTEPEKEDRTLTWTIMTGMMFLVIVLVFLFRRKIA